LETSISADVWKLLGAMGFAIGGLVVYIKALISGHSADLKAAMADNKESQKNDRTEWKLQCDEELGRLTEIIAAEKADKLDLVQEKNRIQAEYLAYVKDFGNG